MAPKKSVLMIGLRPEIIDSGLPDYAAFPGMTAEKVAAGLNADQAELQSLGYDCDLCLTDFGETAETVATAALEVARVITPEVSGVLPCWTLGCLAAIAGCVVMASCP